MQESSKVQKALGPDSYRDKRRPARRRLHGFAWMKRRPKEAPAILANAQTASEAGVKAR